MDLTGWPAAGAVAVLDGRSPPPDPKRPWISHEQSSVSMNHQSCAASLRWLHCLAWAHDFLWWRRVPRAGYVGVDVRLFDAESLCWLSREVADDVEVLVDVQHAQISSGQATLIGNT